MKSLLILKPLPGHTGRRIQFIDADKAIAIKDALDGAEGLTDAQEAFIATVDDVRVYGRSDSSWKQSLQTEPPAKSDVEVESERYR